MSVSLQNHTKITYCCNHCQQCINKELNIRSEHFEMHCTYRALVLQARDSIATPSSTFNPFSCDQSKSVTPCYFCLRSSISSASSSSQSVLPFLEYQSLPYFLIISNEALNEAEARTQFRADKFRIHQFTLPYKSFSPKHNEEYNK